MYEVDDILSPLDPRAAWKTRLWATEDVLDAVMEFTKRRDRPPDRFVNKLMDFARNGFEKYEGPKNPIRAERGFNGVFRIGLIYTKFRIYGFYENGVTRADFVAFDAFVGKKPQLTKREYARVQRVMDIKNSKPRCWRRATHG